MLPKSNLNNIEFLISKDLIDSNIGNDEFVLVKNELEEFYNIKEEIKNSNYKQKFKLFTKQRCLIV